MVWHCRLEFQKRDCWVGVYWRRPIFESAWKQGKGCIYQKVTHIWICIIPCFPIHLIHITGVK